MKFTKNREGCTRTPNGFAARSRDSACFDSPVMLAGERLARLAQVSVSKLPPYYLRIIHSRFPVGAAVLVFRKRGLSFVVVKPFTFGN